MTNTTGQQAGKKMSTSLKTALIVIPVVLIAFAIAIFISVQNNSVEDAPAGESGGGTSAPMVLDDSHVLSDGGEGAPVLVEFFDFECEACGAVYPVIEEIRAQYDGKLTYVPRYFITNHANSMNAALAAEAAAQQGKFEEMFHKLFETQPEWAERQDSQAAVFRGYAEAMGLDMAAYDAAVADPATQARIELDHNAGLKLGVTGTPSFFLDGELLDLVYVSDLTDAIDKAIAERK